MSNFTATSLLTIPLLLSVNACSPGDEEKEIAISEIPSNIINVVQNALPGINLTEAEKAVKDGTIIYQLEGKLINGKKYEAEISETGTILKIELEH